MHEEGSDHGAGGRHGPVETLRMQNVSIAIFENEGGEGEQRKRYYRAKIDKRYRDNRSGDWKSTTSFSTDELLRLRHLIDNAIDLMSCRQHD